MNQRPSLAKDGYYTASVMKVLTSLFPCLLTLRPAAVHVLLTSSSRRPIASPSTPRPCHSSLRRAARSAALACTHVCMHMPPPPPSTPPPRAWQSPFAVVTDWAFGLKGFISDPLG